MTPVLTSILQDATLILKKEGQAAVVDVQILAAISELTDLVKQILAWNDTPNPPVRAFSYFHPPIFRNGVELMASFDLKNDWVVGPVEITFVDDQGTVVPAPAGASFSPTISDPTMVGIVMNDGTHFTINALMLAGAPTVLWHEAASLVPDYTDTINIVEDFTPVAADSNFAGAAHTTQPLPAA